MKRLFTTLATIFLVTWISNNTFAHSNFGGSNPADGSVITEPLNEIVLDFDGQIEQGSFIDVSTTSGQAIEIVDLIIGEGTLTGTIANPLPNDEYQVNWGIVSADGHPLEGQFLFTVNVPIEETTEKTAIEETSENTMQPTENKEVASDGKGDKETSSLTVILIVLLVVIFAGVFFVLTKRKK